MITNAQTVMDALAGVAYATDLHGRIDMIGRRGWHLFAADNGVPEVADRDRFIGRNLFDFITGDDVRAAYGRLLHRIRQGEPQVLVLCRCDSPTVARDMRMTISPLKQGRTLKGFLFQSIPMAERTRPPIRLFEFGLSATNYSEGVPLLSMCSLCERVCMASAEGDEWVEAEVYYSRGGASQVRISHTVCQVCFRHWIEGWTSQPASY